MPTLTHTFALLGGALWKEGRICSHVKYPPPLPTNESAALSTWIGDGNTSWAKESLVTSVGLLGPHDARGA